MSGSRGAAAMAIAVIALVAATTFAFLAFTKDDGAATPEAAARAMVDAVGQGDLLGVLDQLPPGERRALHDGGLDLGNQLQQLGLVSSFDPAALAGVQPSFENLSLVPTDLAKDVTAIDVVGGTMRVPVAAGASPPLTERSAQLLERVGVTFDAASSTYERDFAREPVRLVAIREGGGWHVSLAYSVAEALRKDAGAELPEMGKGPDAIGADSPADAVRDLVKAYADGDPERVLTVLHPDETRAVYDYAPLFLPAAKERAKAADEQGSFDVQLNQLRTEVTGGGPVRAVRITEADLDVRDELHQTHVVYDGHCLHTDARISSDTEPYAKSDTCDDDWGSDDATARLRDNPLANLAVFGGGADLPTFTVIERNGRWFVSPTRTLLDSLVTTLRSIPADKLDVWADRLHASWEAGAGSGISGTPIEGTVAGENPTDDERDAATRAALVAACARLAPGPRGDEVTLACAQHLVDTQRIDVADVPPALRDRVHPAA